MARLYRLKHVLFVGSLLDDGYDTALIGKCHLQNMTGMERAYTPPEAEKCKTDEDGYPDQPTTSKLTGADYENEKLRYFGVRHRIMR